MRYRYKTHSDIPPYMKDYLLSVVGGESLKDVAVEDINNFLNGYDDWMEQEDMSMVASEDAYHSDPIDGVTIH